MGRGREGFNERFMNQAEILTRVGAGSKQTTAQVGGAGRRDPARYCPDLARAFDRAGSSYDDKPLLLGIMPLVFPD